VDWEEYLATLDAQGQQRAARLAADYGLEAASRRVRYYPAGSPAELERALERERGRVRTQVYGLFESIDVSQCPVGWSVSHILRSEAGGSQVVYTDAVGPNGARGVFERGYDPGHRQVELRNAFVRLPGATEGLPVWVKGTGVPMDSDRGTPTVQYFTLYQLKMLHVPAGEVRWWRRWLYRLSLRAGPFASPGVVGSIKMSTIQNVEAIVHLLWLRQRYTAAELSDLVIHIASVEYAETTAVQCGYRVLRTNYVKAEEWERPIEMLLTHIEDGNGQREQEHDDLLARFSFDRQTVMKQNFDIELSVAPV